MKQTSLIEKHVFQRSGHAPAVILVKEYSGHVIVDAGGLGELVFEDDRADAWMQGIFEEYEDVCAFAGQPIVEIFPDGIKIDGSPDEAMTKRLLREYLDSDSEQPNR